MFMTKNFQTKRGMAIIFLSIIFVLALISANFSVANQVKAEGWWDKVSEGGLKNVGPAYGQTNTPDDSYDIRLMIARLIKVALGLLGLIFLVLIIVAGFKWMTAQGDEEKVGEAKKQLSNGVIGLIIVLVAFSIAIFVFNQLEYVTTGYMPVTW